MTHLLAILYVAWSLSDRAAIADLASSITPAQVAIAPGLLDDLVRVEITTGGFVGIHMQIDVLMADRNLAAIWSGLH